MTQISHANLGWNEAGTPVSDQFDDVYFSNVNGLEETRYVFLHQNNLPHRWLDYKQSRFVIGETGFGTGLNFLAVWQYFEQFRLENPDSPLQSLHFISFEKYPLSKSDLIKAHQSWPELAKYAKELHESYPIAAPDCHRVILGKGAITLDLWFGDIKDCMPKVPTPELGIMDTWFLDGFAPSKNPDMWSQELFNGMAKLAKKECHCATFTAAGFVRRGLIDAGFDIKKVKGFGTKREMLAGSMNDKTPISNIAPYSAITPSTEVDDIAIIGGGVASASLCVALAQRGIKPTLYCKDSSAAQGASGNRQGAVYPLLNAKHDNMSRFFSSAFIYARQFVQQRAKEIDFDHQWCGVTQLMWDEKSYNKLNALGDGQFTTDLVIRQSAEETQQQLGLPVSSPSVNYPLGGWLCPSQMTQSIIHSLVDEHKLHALFDNEVEKLDWDENIKKWRLTTPSGIKEHSTVVVANGHLFDLLEPCQKLPMNKVKGQVSHVPTTESLSKLKQVLCYDGYMTPANPSNQHHCIGASYDRSCLDNSYDPDAQKDNKEKLIKCIKDQEWPNDVDISGDLSRQGVRCVSRDHLPFVGNIGDIDVIRYQYDVHSLQEPSSIPEVHQYPNLYSFLGLGSRGLSSAPLLGEVLASMVCGDPIPLPIDVLDKIHPSRMWVRKLLKGKQLQQ